jgi:hypothetical protein
MKELVLFAEIEYSENLLTPTLYEAGIWQFCIYATGSILPFMKDTYNRKIKCVNNVVIDNKEYTRFGSLEELRKYDVKDTGCWVNGNSVIYVRFHNYNPPYTTYLSVSGILMGFTNGKPLLKDGIMYKSGLLTTPQITHSTDAFTYDRMKFNTANIAIDNTDGQFDDERNLLGNEFNLKVGLVKEEEKREDFIKIIEEAGDEKAVSIRDTDEYIVLNNEGEKKEQKLKMPIQYYIEDVTTTLGKIEFKLGDKRERLSAKILNEQYTTDKFPYIDDNLVDKDMQEVYGHCFGVPGVCLQGKQIEARSGELADGEGNLRQYRFRFSSQISRIDRIQVKMTPGEYPDSKKNMDCMKNTDGWTTIWRRETGEDPEDWKDWKDNIHTDDNPAGDLETFKNDGIITLRWDISKQGGIRTNRTNEVRMDGVFISFDEFPNTENIPKPPRGEPRATPKDIIRHILYKYAYVPFDHLRYNISEDRQSGEFIDQLKLLDGYEIGVMFDKSIPVYEAIEKLQGGSVMGFQFQVVDNKFTARIDYPNRPKRKSISHLDIININEVEVDCNASLYGTFTNIEYAQNYSEKEYQRVIDQSKRQDILAIHRMDKEWKATTLLANKKDAELRSNILLEDFEDLRQIIRNIKLAGEKWLGLQEGFDDLRIYDILDIDFSIPGEEIEKYPQFLIKLIAEVGEDKVVSAESGTDEYVIMSTDKKDAIGKRDFMKTLPCKIIGIVPDYISGFTTIDVRVAYPSEVLSKALKN